MNMILQPIKAAFKTADIKGVGIAFHDSIILPDMSIVKLHKAISCKLLPKKMSLDELENIFTKVTNMSEEMFDKAFNEYADVTESEHCIGNFITQLSHETDKGLLVADYEKKDDVGYDAMYLSFKPNESDEYIDVAKIAVTDKLELSSFFDLRTENPDSTVLYDDNEIKEIFKYN